MHSRIAFVIIILSVLGALERPTPAWARSCESIKAQMEAIAANAGWNDLPRLKALEQQYYACQRGKQTSRPQGGGPAGQAYDTTFGEMLKKNNYCGTFGGLMRFCPKGRACLPGGACAPAKAAAPAPSPAPAPDPTPKPMTPKLAEQIRPYSTLAADVYKSEAADVSASGFRRVLQTGNDNGSFFAAAYVASDAKQKSVVIAYRGSDDRGDWLWDNLPGRLMPKSLDAPSQYQRAVEFADIVRKAYPKHAFVVTGHSLGGGLASYTASKRGFEAITFNMARNSYSTTPGQARKQTNVYTVGDIVGQSDPIPSLKAALAGAGVPPGQSYFVTVPDLPAASAAERILWHHKMDSIQSALGEIFLKSRR